MRRTAIVLPIILGLVSLVADGGEKTGRNVAVLGGVDNLQAAPRASLQQGVYRYIRVKFDAAITAVDSGSPLELLDHSTNQMAAAPAPLRDTRERIVEAARYLFWERGYAASGLSEILMRAKANSGSFYHFFDSKDALLRTVLDTYVELLEPYVIRPAWGQTADPIERIFALLEGYRQRLVDTGNQYGCPIGRLALEIDPENTPAHELIARNFAAWRGHVEACLRAAGVPEPGDTAALVLAVMEGAVMQSRAERNIGPFDACIRRLRAHFDRLSPARPRRRARLPKRTS